jgi:hypothetical protein
MLMWRVETFGGRKLLHTSYFKNEAVLRAVAHNYNPSFLGGGD